MTASLILYTVDILCQLTHRSSSNSDTAGFSFTEVGQHIFATFFGLSYVLPLSVIAIFSLCIVRHLSNVEKTSSLGATRRAAPVSGGAPGSSTSSNGARHRGVDKKRHAGRLLVLVVVLFALLWLPVHVRLLVYYFYGDITNAVYQVACVFFSCLAYFNSCVNPIIYNHASKDFRDAFVEVARCGRVQTQQPATSAATHCPIASGGAATSSATKRGPTAAVGGQGQVVVKTTTKTDAGEIGASTTALLAGHCATGQGEQRTDSGSKDEESK